LASAGFLSSVRAADSSISFLPRGFTQVNLVSDIDGEAAFTDPNLVNPWGLVVTASHLWVANNGTGTGTEYERNGFPDGTVIDVPSITADVAKPTGLVLNQFATFFIRANGRTRPAIFLFATEQGTISGWNPAVDGKNAILVVNNSFRNDVYKGLAVSGNRLFAADFHNNRVRVFDGNFKQIRSFTDPFLPAGFAPFGIRQIGGLLFVTFALRESGGDDDVPAVGNGFVDIFTTTGILLRRFASRGTLNSPWGLAVSPFNFGRFPNALLVGNFGDGKINAFSLFSGRFLGQLRDQRTGTIISIPGLWSLSFRSILLGGGSRLFFTAGIDDENHGLLGFLRPGF
jgi:uncharacterized protein (TIGR03118 family)